LTNGFHKLLEMKRRPLNPSSTETQESRPRRYNVAIGCELRK
jgi:hypothetical protein